MTVGGDAAGPSGGEAEAARRHWAGQGRNDFYESAQHWRPYVARRVAERKPSSVLEFGCNVGRNLLEVREAAPDAVLVGIEVNADAVNFGRTEYGLDLIHGGEEILGQFADEAFDVVFTVSVLDHVPHAAAVLRDLVRVAKSFILLEPFTGQSHRLDADGQVDATTTVAFTYAWDYVELCERAAPAWHWTWRPYPISSENAGPYYWLIEGSPPVPPSIDDPSPEPT